MFILYDIEYLKNKDELDERFFFGVDAKEVFDSVVEYFNVNSIELEKKIQYMNEFFYFYFDGESDSALIDRYKIKLRPALENAVAVQLSRVIFENLNNNNDDFLSKYDVFFKKYNKFLKESVLKKGHANVLKKLNKVNGLTENDNLSYTNFLQVYGFYMLSYESLNNEISIKNIRENSYYVVDSIKTTVKNRGKTKEKSL